MKYKNAVRILVLAAFLFVAFLSVRTFETVNGEYRHDCHGDGYVTKLVLDNNLRITLYTDIQTSDRSYRTKGNVSGNQERNMEVMDCENDCIPVEAVLKLKSGKEGVIEGSIIYFEEAASNKTSDGEVVPFKVINKDNFRIINGKAVREILICG